MSKMLDVTNPATGELIESLVMDTAADLNEKVDIAAAAQPAWERTKLNERGKLLFAFCNKIEELKEELGELSAKEMCKPINSAMGECVDAPEIGRGYVERAKHLYGDVFTGTTADREYDLGFTRREALGVILAVIPFNYPVEMTLQKTVPAMIMGNTVIVKAPSSNPLTVKRLVEIAHEVGIPEEVIQFTVCDRKDSTDCLVKSPKIAAVGLTGSTATGIDIIKNSADTMKKVFLELGGNDSLIICEDADIDKAVQEMVDGRIYNNGQICCATKRYLIHKSIKNTLVEKLKAALDDYKPGSALEPGVINTGLVTVKAAETVEAQIKHTVEQGGNVVYGGTRKGNRVDYTIIDDVPKTADVAKDMEIFGPVWPIISFDTEDEAIEITNSSVYGLCGGVVSSDIVKAFNIADRVQSSSVVVNGCSSYRQNEQPWGGCKHSGLGNEGVSSSLEEYSRLKTYVLKGAFVK